MKMFVVWFFLYVFSVSLGCVYIYQNSKNNYLSIVDSELLVSSKIFNNLIKKNHNDSFIKYLSLIEQNSNGQLKETLLLDGHENLKKHIKSLNLNEIIQFTFESQSPYFTEVSINNISTRLSIIPINTNNESQSVLLAFKPIDYIYSILKSNLKTLLMVVFLLSIILLPILIIIIKSNIKHWMHMIKDSNTDSITGIPNQHQLILDLENTTSPNLAFIKILNYNSIINLYGPAVSDNITRQFSTIINGFEDPRLEKSNIYRVQQSTFAILEDQEISFVDIADITGKIVKSLVTFDYIVGENEFINLKVTVGAVRQKKDAFTLANMALSEAIEKQLPYYFINDGEKHLPETYKKDLENIRKIHTALSEDRLVPFFQPIFNAKSLKVEKYESLARIVDENNSPMILPNVFLPLVNREKLNYKITRIILEKSIQFAIKNNVVVSINLGVPDINNETTREFIYSSIKNSGVSQLLQFELLENEAIVDSETVLKFFRTIKKLGSEIGMDDLGKGHSNIERLINLPVDFVKIDRSIMEHITDNLEIQNITKGIIKLAHKKKLKVTAEYCKNKAITDIAIMLGVDTLQGHYFAQASPNLYSPPLNLKQKTV
jgi:EAL domain-containing protein (putative c-di-GMP-specific phosphodiesterase class I)/GGDEF domain-containing protein